MYAAAKRALWIPAFAGMTGFAAARGGGEILAAVSMLFPVRSKGRRGWSFAVIPAKAGIQNRGARRANGRSRPIHAGSWFRRGGPSSGPPHNS